MKVEKFEDLIAWKKAREMTKEIYQFTGDGDFSRDFGLRDQIRRASVSIMSNLAEGFERGSSKEFHQYLVIAKASSAEVRSQLVVAFDVGYLDDKSFHALESKAQEVSRIIGGLRVSIAKQRS